MQLATPFFFFVFFLLQDGCYVRLSNTMPSLVNGALEGSSIKTERRVE